MPCIVDSYNCCPRIPACYIDSISNFFKNLRRCFLLLILCCFLLLISTVFYSKVVLYLFCFIYGPKLLCLIFAIRTTVKIFHSSENIQFFKELFIISRYLLPITLNNSFNISTTFIWHHDQYFRKLRHCSCFKALRY